jgi:hypothetical protein
MYCKLCLTALPQTFDDIPSAVDEPLDSKPAVIPYASPRKKARSRCPRCFREYNPNDPKTYLTTLALTPGQMAFRVILTTLLGIGAAFVVAFHQMVMTSGH